MLVSRAFDVDLLHIAEHFSIPVSEIAVNWHEIPGTYSLAHSVLNLLTHNQSLKTSQYRIVHDDIGCL